jgi:hypothetical protein
MMFTEEGGGGGEGEGREPGPSYASYHASIHRHARRAARAPASVTAAGSPGAAQPAASAWCPVVHVNLNAAECNAANQLNAAAVAGHPQVAVPNAMYVGDPARVTLSIGMPGAGEAMAANTANAIAANGGSQVQTYAAPVGYRMQADLHGVGFTTKLVSPASADQDLGAGAATWIWEVVPSLAGDHQLLFVQTSVIYTDDAKVDHVLAPTTTPHAVVVKIKPGDQAKGWVEAATSWFKSLQGMVVALTALVVAVIALVALFRRRRGP